MAKNVVAAGLADRVEVQVAYAIGVAEPVSVMVETFGTEKIDARADRRADRRALRPAPAARSASTWTCTARSTSRPPPTATSAATSFTWEATDRADALREAAGLAEPVTALVREEG